MRNIINILLTKRRFIYDISLNIIASALPIALLQLVIYPWTADFLGGEEYGLMLTIYSVWIMISNSLGNVLNNIRLLKDSEYKADGVDGDFLVLFRRWNVLNALIVFVFIFIYSEEFNFVHIVFGIITAVLIMSKAYLEVEFRINLDYKSIVINNVLMGSGFVLGFILLKAIGIWELIFVFGYFFSCIFCCTKTKLLKETITKTAKYSKTKKEAYALLGASVIGNLISYADKLVLYPLMGGTAVSIYYTATIIGKICGMLTGPINSVVLSYISRWNLSKRSIIRIVLPVGAAIVCTGYFMTLLISRPLIGLLFPQWVNEVMKYLPVTTATVMIGILSSIISPFVLKFSPMKWQIVISGFSSGVYFISALLLWRFFGLMGFCVGTVIGAVSKLAIMIIVYYQKPVVLID